MKVCSKCKENKSLDEFNKHKYGLTAWCKICVRERSKKYYNDNRNTLNEKHKQLSKEKRQWFDDYKKTLKCVKCNEDHISCLEFHHIDSTTKDFGISSAVRYKNKEKLFKEIEKCIVLCSNCHRKLHWEEKNC